LKIFSGARRFLVEPMPGLRFGATDLLSSTLKDRISILSPRNPWLWVMAPHAAVLGVSFVLWLAWMHGGTETLLVRWMRGPGSFLLLVSPLAEFAFASVAWSQFQPGQSGRRTWTFFGYAALCRFFGTLLSQWLPAIGLLDFLYKTPKFGDLRWFGYFLSGTVALALYGAGLLEATRLYRRFFPVARFTAGRWLVLSVPAIFVVHQFTVLVRDHRDQLSHPSNWLNWATDPLLLGLLFLSMRLCQSSGCMEGGLLGKVWAGYSIGFSFLLLGDMGNWIFNMGYLSWIAASPLAWFSWYPAASGMLAGACCQWQAGLLSRRSQEHAASSSAIRRPA
jgi:hypothetical protein